MVISSVPLFEV